MHTSKKMVLLVLGLMVVAGPAAGEDWPQWRGPHRDGVSAETGLLQTWPEDGPPLLWQVQDIGFGYSTPAVVGDRIYLISNEGNDDEFVVALNAQDGRRIWSTSVGKVGNPDQRPSYPGARSTPTVDGDSVFVLSSDGDLARLDAATGDVHWQKNVRTEFGGKPGEWAYSESPLVDGDLLVCSPGGADGTVVAVNKSTGEVVWQAPLPTADDAAYASAIVSNLNGVKQYIQFLAKGLVGLDAATGKLLWRYEQTAEGSMANIPTPVESDGFVYSASGRGGGGLVHVQAAGDGFAAEQVYFSKKLPTAIGGVVRIGDYLYGCTRQGIQCVEFKTGELKWEERGIGAASLCYADGCLYLHGENGEVVLLDATPEAYTERGHFTPSNAPDRGSSRTWAYPVVANGRLYVRQGGSVWCYNVGAK